MAPVKVLKNSVTSKKRQSKNPIGLVVSDQLSKQIRKQKLKIVKPKRGVVIIKHLPHGFYEEQMKKYFDQFGVVTRLRLCRSRRTGGSKGFAFIEFEHPEVAQIVAETMNNYFMFQKVIKAEYIPPEQQKYNYFKSTVRSIRNKSGKLIWVSSKIASINNKMNSYNDWSDENYQNRTAQQLLKLNKLSKKFSDLHLDISKIIVLPSMEIDKSMDIETKTVACEVDSKKNNNQIINKVKIRPINRAESEKTNSIIQEDYNKISKNSSNSVNDCTPDNNDDWKDIEIIPSTGIMNKKSKRKIVKKKNIESLSKLLV